MKRILLPLFAAALTILTACGGGNVQAQTLANQVQISPTKTVDIANARFINLQPGNVYIQDRNGVTHYGVINSMSVLTTTEAFKNYFEFSNKLLINMTQTSAIECSKDTGTVITWADGRTQAVNDGCAFAERVKYNSHR